MSRVELRMDRVTLLPPCQKSGIHPASIDHAGTPTTPIAHVTASSADVEDHVTPDVIDARVASAFAHVTAPAHTPIPDEISKPPILAPALHLATAPRNAGPNQSFPTKSIIRLAELVLTLNNVFFDFSHFLQTKGVAMGTHMGPSYACLFVGFVEQSLFHNSTSTIPSLFLRYIDDCI
eukprot:g35156.t1